MALLEALREKAKGSLPLPLPYPLPFLFSFSSSFPSLPLPSPLPSSPSPSLSPSASPSPSPSHPHHSPTHSVLLASLSQPQNHKDHSLIIVAGAFAGHLLVLPPQAGAPRAGCPAPRPDDFRTSPRTEMPQPPGATRASARSPSQGKKGLGMVRRSLLCFSWCPLPLVLALDTSARSLAPSS